MPRQILCDHLVKSAICDERHFILINPCFPFCNQRDNMGNREWCSTWYISVVAFLKQCLSKLYYFRNWWFGDIVNVNSWFQRTLVPPSSLNAYFKEGDSMLKYWSTSQHYCRSRYHKQSGNIWRFKSDLCLTCMQPCL